MCIIPLLYGEPIKITLSDIRGGNDLTREKVWVAGASGRMGKALVNALKKNVEYKVFGTDREVDITDRQQIHQMAEMHRPSVIINCASVSDAAYCEKNEIEAYRVNVLGARNLAMASRHLNARIIQLSTDDVFDGKKNGAFTEFDTTEPVSVYGKTKVAAENFVRELNPRHLIVRSSWVYGIGNGDFLSAVLEKGCKKEKIEARCDYISSPTSANELAKFILVLMEQSEYGIYHASAEGSCTRYEFAKAILEGMGMDVSLVVPVQDGTNEPKSTLLKNMMMKMTDIYRMPMWQDELAAYLKTLKEAN